jgi:hypothetical protein
MEASIQYCSAPGADLDRRVAIAIFFVAANGGFAKITHLHGSQRLILCSHHLWQYLVVLPAIVSKEKVHSVRYFYSILFNFNRNAKGLRGHHPLQVYPAHKNGSGQFVYFIELCARWYTDLRTQPGFSDLYCLLHFKTTDRGNPFAEKPGGIEFAQIAGTAALSF